MNIKVIIVWIFAIFVVGGIGLFGYLNQDLLVEQGKEVYTPVGDQNAKNFYCTKTSDAIDSSYTFEMDKSTNQITKLIITYNAKQPNVDAHTAASNIDQYEINGITTTLSGTAGSFMFMVTVDLANYDKGMVDALYNEFQKLGIQIDTITDYNTYVEVLNSSTTGTYYTCR